MRLIFETIYDTHFFEVILSESEIDAIKKDGIVKEIPYGLNDSHNLNIYIRRFVAQLDQEEEEYAAGEREKSTYARRVFGKCAPGDESGQAAKAECGDSL